MTTNWQQIRYPSRIVCTTTESVDILYRLGLGERVVGISGFTTEPPEARHKPKIGSYTTIKLEKIKELKPDLVVTFSDLQAQITHDLVREGFTVFTMNQRSLYGIMEAILMLGSLVGAVDNAQKLVDEIRHTLELTRARAAGLQYRPKVYFEEWHDPLISGIGWVGELIELAGGQDIFPDVKGANASERIIPAEEVLRRNPDLIIASWCGKKVNIPSICRRVGWDAIDAVKNKRVYEVKSAHILQPGPAVLKGLEQIHGLIMQEFHA
jgi:iron complex transport system substrate-binding protein